jgi:hypothetical protein
MFNVFRVTKGKQYESILSFIDMTVIVLNIGPLGIYKNSFTGKILGNN